MEVKPATADTQSAAKLGESLGKRARARQQAGRQWSARGFVSGPRPATDPSGRGILQLALPFWVWIRSPMARVTGLVASQLESASAVARVAVVRELVEYVQGARALPSIRRVEQPIPIYDELSRPMQFVALTG